MNRKLFVAALIVIGLAVLGAGGGWWYVQNRQTYPPVPTIASTTAPIHQVSKAHVDTNSCSATDGRCEKSFYDHYALTERLENPDGPNSFNVWSIVGVTSAGTTTLIDNVGETAKAFLPVDPHGGVPLERIFWEFSTPSTGNRMYFFRSITGIDGVFPENIYSYDAKSKLFMYLPTASKYFNSGPVETSPDGFRMVTVGCPDKNSYDCRTLYVVDLWTDTAKTLITLPAGETFVVPAYDEYTYYNLIADVSWTNNTTVSYSIYDTAKIQALVSLPIEQGAKELTSGLSKFRVKSDQITIPAS